MSRQINLYNPALLTQKQHFSVQSMLQALLLLVAGLALFYGYAQYQVQLLGKQQEESARRYAAMQERLARLSAEFSPQLTQQQLEEDTRRVEAQLAGLQELVKALAAMGNTSGYSEYMRGFARQTLGGLWLTGFSLSSEQMSMSGGALSPELVPAYIKRLGQERSMRGKEFAALQMQQHVWEAGKAGRPYLEFTLQSFEAGEVKK